MKSEQIIKQKPSTTYNRIVRPGDSIYTMNSAAAESIDSQIEAPIPLKEGNPYSNIVSFTLPQQTQFQPVWWLDKITPRLDQDTLGILEFQWQAVLSNNPADLARAIQYFTAYWLDFNMLFMNPQKEASYILESELYAQVCRALTGFPPIHSNVQLNIQTVYKLPDKWKRLLNNSLR